MDKKDDGENLYDDQQSFSFLYAAIRSAEDNVRGYDTKAQIVGIGYIFTAGLIATIGGLSPEKVPFVPVTIVLSWLIGIAPVIFFGAVLHPSRKTAPTLGDQQTHIKKLFFTDSAHHGQISQFLSDLNTADFKKELAYELLKLSALRDLKRKRFLRALWASGLSFGLIFASQVYRSLA